MGNTRGLRLLLPPVSGEEPPRGGREVPEISRLRAQPVLLDAVRKVSLVSPSSRAACPRFHPACASACSMRERSTCSKSMAPRAKFTCTEPSGSTVGEMPPVAAASPRCSGSSVELEAPRAALRAPAHGVAGPRVGREGRQGPRGEAHFAEAVADPDLVEEVLDEKPDVVVTLAQRRQLHGQHQGRGRDSFSAVLRCPSRTFSVQRVQTSPPGRPAPGLGGRGVAPVG
jgi:hypothetical protein